MVGVVRRGEREIRRQGRKREKEKKRARKLKLLTNIVGEEDDKERSDEVVDSLDVAAGGVTHRPDEEYSSKTLLY